MANKKPLIVAIIFGIIAVILVYAYMQSMKKQMGQTDIEYGTVVVAADLIPIKAMIVEGMITEQKMPLENIPPNAYTEVDEVQGLIASATIYEGVFLFPDMFKEKTEIDQLVFKLNPGERAVTIGVTEITGVGGNANTGDHVDVIATFRDNEEVGAPTTFTVARDVRIAAVGTDIGTDIEEAGEDGIARSITLAVEPDEAERIVLASETGNLRLSLRPNEERYSPPSNGVTISDIIKFRPTREQLEKAEKEAMRERDMKDKLDADWKRFQAQLASESGSEKSLQPIVPGLPVKPRSKNVMIELILGGESEMVTVPERLYTGYSVRPRAHSNFGVRYSMPYEGE